MGGGDARMDRRASPQLTAAAKNGVANAPRIHHLPIHRASALGRRDCTAMENEMKYVQVVFVLTTWVLVGCAHHRPTAAVLPKGGGTYDVIGQGPAEQDAYQNAAKEASYTCEKKDKEMVVTKEESVYQGVDKNKKDQVKGENVALAFVTGRSGKERNVDDYKVTLSISCN
jgi:hypothetical protein